MRPTEKALDLIKNINVYEATAISERIVKSLNEVRIADLPNFFELIKSENAPYSDLMRKHLIKQMNIRDKEITSLKGYWSTVLATCKKIRDKND